MARPAQRAAVRRRAAARAARRARPVPLVAQLARGPARRAAQAGDGGARRRARRRARHDDASRSTARRRRSALGIAGSARPRAVADALWDALAAHPALLAEAAVLAAAAVALPYCRGRGPWAAAGFGAAFLACHRARAPAAPCCRSSAARGSPRQYWVELSTTREPRACHEITLVRRGRTPAYERPPHHRVEAGVPLRGRVRPRIQDERAAGRAGAQARQGDGRPPHRLGLARLRAERVHDLPLAARPRAVRRLRGRRCATSSPTTSPSTRAARATCCSPRRA